MVESFVKVKIGNIHLHLQSQTDNYDVDHALFLSLETINEY